MKPKEPTKDISELMEMIKKRQEVLTFQCAVFLKSECNLNGDVAERAKKLIILMEKQNEKESKEIEQAARNLYNKARSSGRQEFICRNCADMWNTDTSDEFEAGKQSAQKKIEELKQQLVQKDNLIDSWIVECGKKEEKLIEFKAEKQEQVRKLKHDLPRMGLSDDAFVKIINKVTEIFQDCILRKVKEGGDEK